MEHQKDVCVRCCEPLESEEARFNRVFWGMAHRKCTSDAMWPPRFRPLLDPNEVMRQIAALVAHLAKISTGRPSGLPIPQILHRGSASLTNVDRSSVLESSSSEHGQRELGVESRWTSSNNAHAMEEQATPGRKRAQRPKSSPQATPSPKPKEARQGERTGDAQASEQHPVGMPPTPPPPPPPPTTKKNTPRYH